jgi:dTDP-4-dehydrorhamnose reductase
LTLPPKRDIILYKENKGKYESGAFDLSMGTPRPTALTQQIAHFVNDTPYNHPILQSDGWWEKPTRLIYGHQIYSNPKKKLNNNVTPVLIIGANGTLGSAFTKLCTSRGITYQALTRNEVDFTDPQQIEAIINKYKPWAIINTAGFVKVDVAEQETKNCFLSNTIGPVNLAINCEKFGIKLLTFSSDLVFDGLKKSSYVESDIVNPLNIYGLSKAKADEQVMHYNPTALIVRTSAFFGPWDNYNFIYQVLDSLKNGKNYCVANDVYISPTYVPDLVSASLNILIDNEIGIWHLANKGELTWYELALEVTQRANLSPQLLKPLSVEELGLKAKRPFFSALSSTKGEPLPPLEQALDHFFESYKFN